MFFLIRMKRLMIMPPSSFGYNLKEEIAMRLKKEVEGTTDGRHGFVVMIDKIDPIEQGKIVDNGHAEFNISYLAVVYRPFKNEVVDAIVTAVDQIGFRCEAGPLKMIVTKEVCRSIF